MAYEFPTQSNVPFDLGNFITPELRNRVKWGSVIIGIIVIYAALNFARSIYTDLLWFDSVGYQSVFRTMFLTRLVLFFIGGGLVALLGGLSVYVANRLARGPDDLNLPPQTRDFLRSLIKWGSVAIVAIVSIIFGAILASKWDLFLKFENSVSFGVIEPVFGKDVGFYVFTLPLLNTVQSWMLATTITVLVVTLLVYFVNFNLRGVGFLFTDGFKVHLSVIAAVLMLTLAGGHWLGRWALVLSDSGAAYGAGYADIHARMPALLIMTIVATVAGILMFVNAYQRGLRVMIGAVALWVVMSIFLSVAWPNAVQRFTVNPNEFTREEQYIARNIDLTRKAFDLDGVVTQPYAVDPNLSAEVLFDNAETIANIRLWDHGPVSDVYKQIQQIRPYYDFNEADVDRYTVDGKYRQVMVSAREVNPDELNVDAQTWVNRRLRFTHGFGIAMSPVTEFTSEGRPEFFAKDIPSDGIIAVQSDGQTAEPETVINNPRIYYGEFTKDFIIVDSNTEELDYQAQGADIRNNRYDGDGGVPIGSFLNQLAYAWQFGDLNVLITGEINGDSKIQYRRQIAQRVSTIAPFLRLDEDPYIVAAEGGLFWIQDAYTITDHYPYSDPVRDQAGSSVGYNYIRNSVKVAIDAYNGTPTFYVSDPDDPIILAFEAMFPKLFTPMAEMPESLKVHTRYPIDLFAAQSDKYLRYHMLDSRDFYNLEDIWDIPTEKFGQGASQIQAVEPYYAIMKLPGEVEGEFILLIPYTRNDPPIMAGWLAARNDAPNLGELVAFEFPKERQVDSPVQIEARIDNDPDISEWFTLRCQEGSECIRGNLLVLPMVSGDQSSLLYAEPVYLQAEGIQFPELKQVILATADRVVMRDSVEEAVTALLAGTRPPPGRPDTGEPTTPSDPSQTAVEQIDNAIQGLKDSIQALEDALNELTQGEQ
jgi:hypothetical protein